MTIQCLRYRDISVLQVLLLPMAVSLITAVSLLLRMPLTAFQWWAGVSVVASLGILAKSPRDRMAGLALFAAALFIYWCITSAMLWPTGCDNCICYQPAALILKEGWNPIWAGTPQQVTESFGITADDFKLMHMIAVPKSTWYFNAAASFFCGEWGISPKAVILPLIAASLVCTIWRYLAGANKLLRISATIAIPLLALGYATPGLNIVAYVINASTIGLLANIAISLRTTPSNRLLTRTEMFVYSFWMATAKPAGIPPLAVIWCAWAVCKIAANMRNGKYFLRSFPLKRFALFALFVSVELASPVYSSWKDFGHPLYPNYTADPVRFPVAKLINDLSDENADASSMSHFERYVYAWISRDAVKFYRKHFCGQADFNPANSRWFPETTLHAPWSESPRTAVDMSILENHTRMWCQPYHLILLTMIFTLLVLGDSADRTCAIAIMGSLFAMPTVVLGYWGYTGWCFAAPLLLICRLPAMPRKHAAIRVASNLLICCVVLFITVYRGGRFVFEAAKAIDAKAAYMAFMEANPCATFTPDIRSHMALLKLRKRFIPRMHDIRIVPPDSEEASKCLSRFYDNSCNVDSSLEPAKHLDSTRFFAADTALPRCMAYPAYCLHEFFVTAPATLCKIATGR